jgi:hypothetical protein
MPVHASESLPHNLPLMRHRNACGLAHVAKFFDVSSIHQFLLNNNYYCSSIFHNQQVSATF